MDMQAPDRFDARVQMITESFALIILNFCKKNIIMIIYCLRY